MLAWLKPAQGAGHRAQASGRGPAGAGQGVQDRLDTRRYLGRACGMSQTKCKLASSRYRVCDKTRLNGR